MSEQLIWLKFINPDDVYTLNPLFNLERQCSRCGKTLYIPFQANELNEWSIVQPRGDIDSGFIKVSMIEPLVLKNEEKVLLLEGYSFKQPDYHSCQWTENSIRPEESKMEGQDQVKIAHYHNLLKLIKDDSQFDEDTIYYLRLYVDHAIEGKPIDKFDEVDYARVLSTIARQTVKD